LNFKSKGNFFSIFFFRERYRHVLKIAQRKTLDLFLVRKIKHWLGQKAPDSRGLEV